MNERRWTRSNFQPCLPLGEDGRRVTECPEHIALSREAAGEGMVLLKNDGVLPLKKGTKIAIFGKAQIDFVKGGGGSGDVIVSYVRNIYDGFKVKEAEGKIAVFDEISWFYKEDVRKQYENGVVIGHTEEPEIPPVLLNKAADFTDTAIITICRFSEEAWDRKSEKGDFYLSDAEEKMVNSVSDKFKNVAVVLDVGGVVDTLWFKEEGRIGAALLAWNAGMEGGLAVADIVCGDVNPSGKLVDTFAKSFDDYPSSANFHDSDDYVKYYDDIYVGYRYFETVPGAKERVSYPFGFGLSYTDFEISDEEAYDDGKVITVTATVKNIGKMAGKETIQVYYTAPDGKLDKPSKELCAFKKTGLLAPGESETVVMKFDISEMASYDDRGKVVKSAYILEWGDYKLEVGNSVRNTKLLNYRYTVNGKAIVSEQLTELVAPCRLEKRLCSDGSYEELETKELKRFEYAEIPENTAKPPEEKAMLEDVADGKVTMDEFIAQLSDKELCRLAGGTSQDKPFNGKHSPGVATGGGYGNLREYGIPPLMPTDGPAGVRVEKGSGVCTTAWPCATLLACTWNTDLIYRIGSCGAMEAKENNLVIWLTPALNIHRTPLCGRNFEYYSEDPLIAGEMAAALTNGIQSQGVGATPKHFACNNKETNRRFSDSILSERALREIYIKGFEICVKKANPWMIMTSYNKINGYQASEHYELITGILRGEWGFKGMVTSDWCTTGIHGFEVKAGNDVKMPLGYPESLMEFLYVEKLKRPELEACVKRLLELIIKIDC